MPQIPPPGSLMKAMMKNIHDIITGGDARFTPDPSNFFSWCFPGIPFKPSSFDFCAKGLSSSDPKELSLLYQQAYNFASFVDFIPDYHDSYNSDKQETIFQTTEARLSYMFKHILQLCKVVDIELTDKEKAIIKKVQDFLSVTKTQKDPFTDEETSVTQPSAALLAYHTYEKKWRDALLAYNNKRIAAQAQSSAQAVADWANNADIYWQDVTDADGEWATLGYKNQMKEAMDLVNQITLRSMVMWKQGLLEAIDKSVQHGSAAGQDFLTTTVVPGDFASPDAGWLNFSFGQADYEFHSKSESTSYGASAGVSFGLWSASAHMSRTESSSSVDTAGSDFKISFDITQVPIVRPWFSPEFFMSRGWDLQKGVGWSWDLEKLPSNGDGNNPDGCFLAYPTAAFFVRNLLIKYDNFQNHFDQHKSSIDAGGSVGYGPFSVGGNYSHSEAKENFTCDSTAEGLMVQGMQLLGFACHLIPKAPNLLPELKNENLI